MNPSDNDFIHSLNNLELFVCLRYTKTILNDKSDQLLLDFLEDTNNSDFYDLVKEMSLEEKRIQINLIYIQYLTEFNWRNRN